MVKCQHSNSEELTKIRDMLASRNKARTIVQQGKRTYRVTLVLLLGLIAICGSVVLVAVFMRGQLKVGNNEDSRGKHHVKIKVSSKVEFAPHNHSLELHQQAEKLAEIARDPEKLALYMALPTADKEEFLAEEMRQNAEQYLSGDKCQGLEQVYKPLVDDMLSPFLDGINVEEIKKLQKSPSAIFYIVNGKLYVEGNSEALKHPMVVLWENYFYWLLQEVKLPNLVLPVNADDFPVGKSEPWFSFCRQRRRFNDILLPNLVEDGLFPVERTLKPSRAGREDTRRPMAIWLGRPMSWHRSRRKEIVREGVRHPEKIYAGFTAWDNVGIPDFISEEELLEYHKPHMPLDDWAEHFKYVINVEGNCGSARLAKQLYSDAAVLLVAGEDEEWYYPLLKPYKHFIPVTVETDGSTNLVEQILWAESHPDEVRSIVDASTAFAFKYLAPQNGRDCYTVCLLREYSALANFSNLQPPQNISAFISLEPPWSKITSSQRSTRLKA